jgi:hypothetical protein
LPNTGYLKSAMVGNMNRAFWRGDTKKEPLQVRLVPLLPKEYVLYAHLPTSLVRSSALLTGRLHRIHSIGVIGCRGSME